jgi:hypothetical protein
MKGWGGGTSFFSQGENNIDILGNCKHVKQVIVGLRKCLNAQKSLKTAVWGRFKAFKLLSVFFRDFAHFLPIWVDFLPNKRFFKRVE